MYIYDPQIKKWKRMFSSCFTINFKMASVIKGELKMVVLRCCHLEINI